MNHRISTGLVVVGILVAAISTNYLLTSQESAGNRSALVASTGVVVQDFEETTLASEEEQQRTLKSFRKVDDHPLFEMRFHGDYTADNALEVASRAFGDASGWACSIFVSYGEEGQAIYGRNFDWQNNPALLLHTNPSDGFASVSMVDISYLGYSREDAKFDTIEGRKALLTAPLLPFDGMNEHGLTVGMAAVGNTDVPRDPAKKNVGSLQIIRLMLDRARNADEALELFQQHNIVSRGGPNIHYLIADAQGGSAVIELVDGETNIIRGDKNWQSATNFYLTGQDKPLQQCWRFAQIDKQMTANSGELSVEQTFGLLEDVSQANTRWSVVYDMKNGQANVVMSRDFATKYSFPIQSDEALAKEPK